MVIAHLTSSTPLGCNYTFRIWCVKHIRQAVWLYIGVYDTNIYTWKAILCHYRWSNPKQPSCKKSVRPSERLWWKKMWNPRWRPRNGCDGRLMVKILITTIQVNFCAASQNLPKLSLLKFLPLTYHHSHFLAATLDFTSFFTIAFLRAAHFFYSLAVLD